MNNIFHFLFGKQVKYILESKVFALCADASVGANVPGSWGAVISYKSTSSEISKTAALFAAVRGVGGVPKDTMAHNNKP